MKQGIFIPLVLVMLTGCSEGEVKKEEDATKIELIQETMETTNDLEGNNEDVEEAEVMTESVRNNDSGNKDIDISESSSTEQSNSQTESIKNNEQLTNSVAFQNMLYFEEISPKEYNGEDYLSIGDKVEITDNGKVYATVTFNNFKIVDDKNETGRKAIAFFYTQTNVSDSDIESGPFGIADNPTFSVNFIADDKNFKIMSHTTPSLKMYDENYIENQHVEYTEADAGVESCMRVKVLKPGESRECYAHYTLLGTTTYKLEYMSEINLNEWQTYSFKVTREDIIK